MRIAFSINVSAIAFGAVVLFGTPLQSVQAADLAPSVVTPPTVTASAASEPATTVAAALPVPATPKTASPAGQGMGGALNTLEKQVPDSVKEIVKHLDKTTEDVTLDDLNSARQAVAKIEALIEIEKHLAELEKVRDEREKKVFAGAIPASALQPPSGMPMGTPVQQMPMQAMGVDRVLEVSRIIGRNGHYSAVMRMSNDKTKTVQVGEQLPDGSRVVSISTTTVDVMHGNVRQTLHVKNVETVYGNNPL